MKHHYMIALHREGKTLYYNEDYNFFGEKNGTIYKSRQKAHDKLEYAMKYGTSGGGLFEVVKF